MSTAHWFKSLHAFIALLALFSGAVIQSAIAQITSENSDQHAIVGARAAALGDAYVSEAFDVSSMYWNPAGLVSLQRHSVVTTIAVEKILPSDYVMTENVAVPLPQWHDWAVGIGATMHHVGKLAAESRLSGLSFTQYSLDLACARMITQALSLGAGVTLHNGRTSSGSRWAGSTSFGIYYSPSAGISYGASFQGLGTGIQFPYDRDSVGLASVNDIAVTQLSRSLQIGLTMRFPTNEPQVVAITLANQKVFGRHGVIYKGGIEWFPVGALAVRLGYWVGHETVSAKFGAGWKLSRLQIDYAVSPGELEPQFHQLSISYAIGG